MEKILLNLLLSLEGIGDGHEELYDSEVRQRMSNAIMDAFIRARPGFHIPENFGLYSAEANSSVRAALDRYIQAANREATKVGIGTFHDRLASVQNRAVRTPKGNDYDDFLGYSPPDLFDEFGRVVQSEK